MREPFRKNGKWGIEGQDLFFRDQPKSCARCKSKYWKEPFRHRRTKHISDVVKDDLKTPSITRFKALLREFEFNKAINLRPEYKDWVIDLYKKINS